MARLIYISNNVILAGGKLNPFFLQEKQWLLDRFGSFAIVCPKGIYCCENNEKLNPVQTGKKIDVVKALLVGGFDPEAWKELFRMIKEKKFSPKNVLKLFRFSVSAARMAGYLKKCLKDGDLDNTVLYSYWLSFDAAAVAKMKRKYPQVYAFARAHAYEIQLERNACNPYLMKKLICKNLDKVVFISQNAKDGFCSYYKEDFPNACVQYLGSDQLESGCVSREKKETLTILTCSSIVPVKYLERMVAALSHWQDGKVKWIHIGDGADGEKIRLLAKEKLGENPLISYEFLGYMENGQLHKFLTNDNIDVFVNCSRTEGVPVSIMEAMSVGLPVIAPEMFGIPELVRDDCGLLFAQDEGYENLLNALRAFAELSKEEREKMGRTAYEQWKKRFCLQRNLQELFSAAQK